MKADQAAPRLNVFDATMIVMGGIIGVGIFLTPHQVAQHSPNETIYLGVWLLGGLITLTGAVTYADLGACLPYAGGIFTYIHDGLGKSAGAFFAYMFAWMTLFVTATGTIAILLSFAALTARGLLSEGPVEDDAVNKSVALVLLIVLTAVAISGVKFSAMVQNTLMVIKIGVLLTLIVAGLLIFIPPETMQTAKPAVRSSFHWQTIPAALLPALFAYGGSYHLGNLANQVRRPAVNIPRAVLIGVSAVLILYLLVNSTYLHVLGLDGVEKKKDFCNHVAEQSLGSFGKIFLGVGIVISTLGTSMVAVFCIPWVYVAMAERKLFFQRFGRVHPGTNAPRVALFCQGAIVMIYIIWSQAGPLINLVVFVTALFEALAAVSLLLLRGRRTDLPAPPIKWAYPICPILFLLSGLLVGTGFVVQLQKDWEWTVVMVVYLAVGVLSYLLWRQFTASATTATD